ncbi:hypothetical protein LO054_002780, partial [Salmonella enterica]|nr:hypothetical protein [Salmonella enterica]ECL6903908.1 hypothetical protein [Salmonella enterica subsp. enterica serovar Braenderup]EAQ8721663.1 hypothetical protein [Salmonella enterica]EBG7315843.1 hypothetical protein [Salmonella enterica]ECJ9090053.1 hypothetical protein [Salmonella enterica]
MFNWLAEKYIDNKLISKAIKNLQVEFSPEHKKSLEHAVGLAYYFYAQSENESAKKIAETMSIFLFNGNYDYWTWIESALALHARIARIEGDIETHKKLVDIIWGAFEIGDETKQRINKKIFIRTLKGGDIGFDKVTACMEDGDTISEVNYRFSCLRKMILIREVGASETYPIEQAEKDIEDNIIAIKKLLCS